MAVIHLDPWTDIVNVSWATPAPFMCFPLDIQRGPSKPFQSNMRYNQPYDWSADLLSVPITTIEDPAYGRFVTAFRFIWFNQRIEKLGTYSSAQPQEGTWSGGVRDYPRAAVTTFYRLVGGSWEGLLNPSITPTGLPDLPDTRTITRGTIFAGHGSDNNVDPTPNLEWDALAGSTITTAPTPPGTSSPWKADTSTTIRLKGIALTRIGVDGDGKSARFNGIPPGFEYGAVFPGSVPYAPSVPVSFAIDGSWVATGGSYPDTFSQDLSVSRSGMTWTFQGRTYAAVAFCRDAPAGSSSYQPGPGRMWVLGELQPL
jgi:hypothetical protein